VSRVLVVGDVLIDELVDESGSTSLPGGSALNVAVGLSVLGIPATLAGMVGDDDDAQTIRAYLARYGVPLIASINPLGTGRAVSDRTAGEPTYSFNQSCKQRRLDFDDELRSALSEAGIVAISGYPFDNDSQAHQLATALAGAPASVAVDPNPRAGMLSDAAAFRRNLEQLAPMTDLIKLGDDDAGLLYTQPLATAIPRYLALGTGVVLATRGAAGASLLNATTRVDCPIRQLTAPIVDTMGAGDATFATIVAGMHRGLLRSSDNWPALLSESMGIAAETIRSAGALLRLPSPASGPRASR
jgi:fructokinase